MIHRTPPRSIRTPAAPRRAAAVAALLATAIAPGSAAAHGDDPAHRCGLLPPALLVAAPPVPTRARELQVDLLDVARVRAVPRGGSAPRPDGALAGKTVYLSAGHGWTWMNGRWTTQRPTMEALVEDLVSAETMSQYLIPHLRNMGAYVVPVRDPGLQPELVIVDDDDATAEGDLDERGGAAPGWGEVAFPLAGNTSPFDAGTTRLFAAAPGGTGRLVYAPAIPATGHYEVYVSYVQGPDRAPDAHYAVAHAGGTSHVRVDQRRHGMTWVFLGRYWFEAGAPASRASVTLHDDSEAPGVVVSADAVRFGAGAGLVDRGGGAHPRPTWEHNARTNAQLCGAPPSVYDPLDGDMLDDIAGRGRFAAWDHEPGEDAVYVAWHTNGSVQRGTESFTYSPFGDQGFGTQADFTGVPGSLELQDAVHDRLIADLRAGWDPTWIDRGKKTAYFGEVNPANNGEMPSVLLEVAFHDHPSEADSLREPRFRDLAARAIARGVAGYFAERDGAPLVLPPDAPTAVRVENDGEGGLRVAWRAPAGSTPVDGYRVFVSADGHGFDDGHDVAGEELVLEDLAAGDVRFVRVAARNAGGASFPTEVVGARVAVTGAAPVLVVGGFDRLDAAMMPIDDLGAFGMAPAQRMLLDRMNDGSYAARHGRAIADAGSSFDGAMDDAVDLGDVELTRYVAVDWLGGEVSLGDEPFTAAERAAITSYVAGGGRLLVSGAELAWALDLYGEPAEQTFYRDVVGALYAGDDAGTYRAAPTDGIFAGLPELDFAEQGPGSYDAEWPDVLAAPEGAAPVLTYAGGAGVAAVSWARPGGAAAVVLGFPFELIVGADARRDVMARTLDFLGVPPEPEIPPSGQGGGGSDGGAGGDDLDGPRPGGEDGGGEVEEGRDPGAIGADEHAPTTSCDCKATPGAPSSGAALALGGLLVLGLGARRRGASRGGSGGLVTTARPAHRSPPAQRPADQPPSRPRARRIWK